MPVNTVQNQHNHSHPVQPTESIPESCCPTGAGASFLAIIISLALIGLGGFLIWKTKSYTVLATGCASFIGVLAISSITTTISKNHQHELRERQMQFKAMSERLQQLAGQLHTISDQQLLSDRAKQVAFRGKDRDALRQAIREDLSRKDWEAALALVADMERTFGYKQEAEEYRDEINNHRAETVRKIIQESVLKIDQACRQEKWNDALRESDRLHRHYPESEQVQRLPVEIENKRQATKRHLLDAWQDSLTRKDNDLSIQVLKQLDPYLTRQEAESMQEAARGVFKEKLNQLGAQFTLACQDQRFPDAVRIGEVIVRDFPNSGIARDVRGMMESLKQKKAELETAR